MPLGVLRTLIDAVAQQRRQPERQQQRHANRDIGDREAAPPLRLGPLDRDAGRDADAEQSTGPRATTRVAVVAPDAVQAARVMCSARRRFGCAPASSMHLADEPFGIEAAREDAALARRSA